MVSARYLSIARKSQEQFHERDRNDHPYADIVHSGSAASESRQRPGSWPTIGVPRADYRIWSSCVGFLTRPGNRPGDHVTATRNADRGAQLILLVRAPTLRSRVLTRARVCLRAFCRCARSQALPRVRVPATAGLRRGLPLWGSLDASARRARRRTTGGAYGSGHNEASQAARHSASVRSAPMIRTVHIRGFKRFDELELRLPGHAVLTGANDTGKTTVLQAIASWSFALQRWHEVTGAKRRRSHSPVPITRQAFSPVALRSFDLLWRNRAYAPGSRIEIEVEHRDGWSLTMEFIADSTEHMFVRPAAEVSVETLRAAELRVVLVSAMGGGVAR